MKATLSRVGLNELLDAASFEATPQHLLSVVSSSSLGMGEVMKERKFIREHVLQTSDLIPRHIFGIMHAIIGMAFATNI